MRYAAIFIGVGLEAYGGGVPPRTDFGIMVGQPECHAASYGGLVL